MTICFVCPYALSFQVQLTSTTLCGIEVLLVTPIRVKMGAFAFPDWTNLSADVHLNLMAGKEAFIYHRFLIILRSILHSRYRILLSFLPFFTVFFYCIIHFICFISNFCHSLIYATRITSVTFSTSITPVISVT